MTKRTVAHGKYEVSYPWGDETHLSGGERGLVIRKHKGNYNTAFFEAYPDNTFIRGEGETLADAEHAAWEKYQQQLRCPGHEYERRGYSNGAGVCKHCHRFQSSVFNADELGVVCSVCDEPTFYFSLGTEMYCEEHEPSIEEKKKIISKLQKNGELSLSDMMYAVLCLEADE